MSGLKGTKTRPEDHPAYKLNDGKPRLPAPSGEGNVKHDLVNKIYLISERKLRELKGPVTNIRISTHDAISALIWRSVLVNRVSAGILNRPDDDERTTRYFIPVNARRHLGLGADYIGNAVYHTCCSMKMCEILHPDSLPIAAVKIREAINTVDADRVGGLAEFSESLPQLGSFYLAGLSAAKTTDIAGTSFYHDSSMYGADWGEAFGHHVVRVRPTDAGFGPPGLNCVLPIRTDGRGCEVQLCVERQAVDAMEQDDVFKRFFTH